MSRLIPKHDYFKQTTRVILTEAEKQEIVDAVQRALNHLFQMSERKKYKYTSLANGGESLQITGYKLKYLIRCGHLVKGSTQPRYLYRHSRTEAVEKEARKIAKETGASYKEVKEAFLSLLEKYIDPSP